MLILFCAGAVIMPGRQEFQALHSIPLFIWLKKQPLQLTWWLWSVIGILSVLSLNTLFCSIESIIKKRKVTQWLLLISPQVIHIGFLFILLAHLLSARGGYQTLAAAAEGSYLQISKDTMIQVKAIDILMNPDGYINDWQVRIQYLSNGEVFKKDTIRPNKPSTPADLNVNVKDLRLSPRKAVLLQISREPGAQWALVGGIIFMAGIFTLVILKIKRER
jgi:hypothetical protein